MGAFSGMGGDVIFASGYKMGVYTWTMDYTAEALEVTTFASGGYRDFVPGLRSWAGSYECRLDNTIGIEHPGKPAAYAEFRGTAGVLYTGLIIITSISLSVAVDGVATAVFSFQGSGHVVIAGVTTTTTAP